jgi:hypothetical protein
VAWHGCYTLQLLLSLSCPASLAALETLTTGCIAGYVSSVSPWLAKGDSHRHQVQLELTVPFLTFQGRWELP